MLHACAFLCSKCAPTTLAERTRPHATAGPNRSPRSSRCPPTQCSRNCPPFRVPLPSERPEQGGEVAERRLGVLRSPPAAPRSYAWLAALSSDGATKGAPHHRAQHMTGHRSALLATLPGGCHRQRG